VDAHNLLANWVLIVNFDAELVCWFLEVG